MEISRIFRIIDYSGRRVPKFVSCVHFTIPSHEDNVYLLIISFTVLSPGMNWTITALLATRLF
ncbi:MAG TPA: hypothetical protein VN374_05220, partial [Desulfitobacteriaceae bacterium]|nr:hypothetical protein [Desulfitobacteriaceae bacterium]